MRTELPHELEVAAPADAVWAVYSSPDLAKIIVELFPGVFEKIEIVEGDGGVGTVLRLVYPPESVPLYLEEKFVTIDHEKRLKEVLKTKGGYLDLGCTFYMDIFHIVEKDHDSCIIKSLTIYECEDEDADKLSSLISIDSVISMAEGISNHVIEKQEAAAIKHGHLLEKQEAEKQEAATIKHGHLLEKQEAAAIPH